MRFTVFTLLAIVLAITLTVNAQINPDQDVLIFADEMADGKVQIVLQSSVETAGWLAFGINPYSAAMQGSDIIVAFFDPITRNVTLSRRVGGVGHMKPDPATLQGVKLVEELSGDMDGTLQVAFIRDYQAMNSDQVEIKKDGTVQYFIWAHGNTKRVSTSLDPSGYELQPHLPDNVGTVGGYLLSSYNSFTDPTDDQENHNDLLTKLHGALMFLAWGVFAPLGIILARFFKNMMGVWWFRAHVALLFIGAGGCTIAGFVIIYYVSAPDHFRYDENGVHVVLGLALFIAILIQIVQGFVSHYFFNPLRSKVPWWDQLHWWLGRLVILGCWINVFTGLQLYEANGADLRVNWAMIFVFYVVVLFLAYLMLHICFKRTHHVADDSDKAEGPTKDSDPLVA